MLKTPLKGFFFFSIIERLIGISNRSWQGHKGRVGTKYKTTA